MKISFLVLFTLIWSSLNAQNMDELPYSSIPDYPDDYSGLNVAARMIDGLGFRYYWATESLRQEDLDFKPSETARSSYETLQHIYQMSVGIMRSVKGEMMTPIRTDLAFEDMRRKTLENLAATSELLKSGADLNNASYRYERKGKTIEFPFWNVINGQMSDCLWHVGQVVSFRRASGNPFNSKASVFTGTVRD